MKTRLSMLTILIISSWTVAALAQEAPEDQRARNPLIRAYQDLLNQSEFENESDADQIRDMLRESDELLTRIKLQNAEALRNVNRQSPGISGPTPNILVLSVDDLAISELGAYGAESAETPNIDRLAASGVTLKKFHAASPLDDDAFWCLMTGLDAGKIPHDNEQRAYLLNGQLTLISQLYHAGYHTAFFGGWPLAGRIGPMECYSEVFIGWKDPEQLSQRVPGSLYVNNELQKLELDGDENATAWSIATVQALASLERKIEPRPFGWMIRYHSLDFDSRGAAVAALDHEVGRILKRLDQLKLLNSTLIWLVGETSHPGAQLASAGEVRSGLKTESLLVPSIVTCPQFIPPRSGRYVLSGTWDLMPTFATITRDLRYTRNLHGVSLYSAIVKGETPDRLLYWSVPLESGQRYQAAQTGLWKGVVAPGSKEVQVFDLRNDPNEETNVADDHPEVIRKLVP